MGMKPLPVFQRTNQLLQDIKLLENVTQKQNELLKIVIKQTDECNEEIENLKQILNNYSTEFSHERISPDQTTNLPQVQGNIKGMEKQILSLTQKREDLLVDLKAAILNLHQHLQQDQQESEQEMPSTGASEEEGVAERDASEWKLNKISSMSFLPALKEEVEESSLKSENGDKKAKPSSGSLLWKHDGDMEEDRASSSSGTIIQEAVEKISTCDNPMAQILAPDSLSPNQTEEGATPTVKAAALGFSNEQGAFETTVEKARSKPAENPPCLQDQGGQAGAVAAPGQRGIRAGNIKRRHAAVGRTAAGRVPGHANRHRAQGCLSARELQRSRARRQWGHSAGG